MTAVIHAAVFFETSSDADCNPDVAVSQLEQLAHTVGQLSPAEREEFRRHGDRLAAEHPNPADGARVRETVDALIATFM
jgi:hypothetical protein